MPPLFTSTSLTTFIRQIRGVAKYIQQPATVMSRTAPKRTINTLGRARNAVHQLAHQTFPSLSTPAHQLHQSTTIRAGVRFVTSSAAGSSSKTSQRHLGAVGRALQASKRPQWGHGRSIPSNVGLGSARGFVSAPAAGGIPGNVPIALRAFANLVDDEYSGKKPLPRASRYSPYAHKSRRTRRKVCKSIDSSFISDLHHYFPLVAASQLDEVKVDLPPLPEQLVTPGKSATLAIPLSPSLEALLNPTSSLTYPETSIGVHILARLTAGLLPIHSAFSLHSSTRVIPLLTKLDGLGVMEFHPGGPNVLAEVVRDAEGRPDILRLIFEQRSSENVKALLGGSLRENEEGVWWALWDEEDKVMELTQGERRAMMERWDGCEEKNEHDQESLIYPTLDVSLVNSTDSPLIRPPPNEVSSFNSTPSTQSTLSLSSLLSHMDDSMDGSSEGWSIPPSEADTDVDSVYAGNEEWGDVSSSIVSMHSEQREESSDDGVSVWWAGAGEGFGFVAQPW